MERSSRNRSCSFAGGNCEAASDASKESDAVKAWKIASRFTFLRHAFPMPCSRSRDSTQRQSISRSSAFFGIDADHCVISCLASLNQARSIVDSLISQHRSPRTMHTRKPPRKRFRPYVAYKPITFDMTQLKTHFAHNREIGPFSRGYGQKRGVLHPVPLFHTIQKRPFSNDLRFCCLSDLCTGWPQPGDRAVSRGCGPQKGIHRYEPHSDR